MRRNLGRAIGPALFVLGAVVVALLPRFMGEFRLLQFTLVAVYVIALLSLGRPGLELLQLDPPSWLPLGDGMTPIFTIPIAALVTGVLGLLIGIPALRLGGISLALATLALAVSFPILMKRYAEVTGGGGGINLNLPETPFGWDISTRHWLYYEAWVTAGILFLLAWLLVRGRIGRAWRAIRDGEVAATSSGVNPALYKTFAFGVSAAYAGAAGALFAIEIAYVNPDTFPVALSILLLASAVIGGLGSLAGAVFGALLYEFLPIYSQEPPVGSFDFADQATPVVFGVFLIVIMLLLPGGVVSGIRRLWAFVVGAMARRPSRQRA
jgi:branched-chain amino acid transport system permease protein